MALRKDTALALTGSQLPGWEPILGGSASSSLTRGRASFRYIPSLEAGNETTQAFGLFLVPFENGYKQEKLKLNSVQLSLQLIEKEYQSRNLLLSQREFYELALSNNQ
jgi:hypothetical protein